MMAATTRAPQPDYVTPESSIRVKRLELEDGGILDPEDTVDEVLNGEMDQILAIYDDGSSNTSTPAPPPHFVGVASSSGDSTASACGSMSSSMTSPPIGGDYKLQSSASGSATSGDKQRSGRVKESGVVEITSLENPPTSGLRVSNTSLGYARPAKADDNLNLIIQPVPLRSSLRTADQKDTPPRKHNRVTMSPEVEKKLSVDESSRSSATRLERSSARKSRISDNFFDAMDRLEDRHQPVPSSSKSTVENGERRKTPLLQHVDGESTVIVFPDETSMTMGVEITGITDEEGKLTSVQIIRIDEDGRVGLDGRLTVGDNIIEIDGRPVKNISILRARASLHDLAEKPTPSLTVARSVSSFAQTSEESRLHSSGSASSLLSKRPILSALQQANTQQIGQTKTVEIRKSPAGFGFTVTGRETAKGERLFYIGTVKLGGAAVGLLKAGDRLLKINGESTSGLRQGDVVDRLKATKTGGTVELEISRVGNADEDQENTPPEDVKRESRIVDDGEKTETKRVREEETTQTVEEKKKEEKNESEQPPSLPGPSPPIPVERTGSIHAARMVMSTDSQAEDLELLIPLNDTGSAGLGVSLKARVSVKSDGTRQDCGIFVKKLLVGGAAWKDGRLQVDDQLISIENIDLRQFARNAEASEAVTSKLKEIGPTSKAVRLQVCRQSSPLSRNLSHSSEGSRVTVDGPDASILVGHPGLHSPIKMRREGKTDSVMSNDHDRRTSTASTSTRRSETEVVEDDLQPNPDAFDREAPQRKSMSEKRGMGAAIDPSSIATYQKIKHQRQTSAPSASTVSRSFHGRSASQRAQARARSQSVHPREPASDKRRSTHASDEAATVSTGSSRDASPKRRSQSVDANRINGSSVLVHEMVADGSGGYGNSAGFKNPSFKAAVGEYENGRIDPALALLASGSPSIVARHNAVQMRDKEKQQRRKSVGSAMKNWFRIGSRSRDNSPEKNTDETRRREEEERQKIQDQYERLRAREAALSQMSHSGTPPLSQRRDRQRVQSEYEPAYMQHTTITDNPLQSPTANGFSVANSKFYRSLGPRSEEARQWRATAAVADRSAARPPLTTSDLSTDTSNTDGRGQRLEEEEATPPSHSSIPRNTNSSIPTTRNHHHTMPFQVPTPITEEVGPIDPSLPPVSRQSGGPRWAESTRRIQEEATPTLCHHQATPPPSTILTNVRHPLERCAEAEVVVQPRRPRPPLPPTTTPSTRGSPIPEAERSERGQVSRPHSLAACASPLLLNPTPLIVSSPQARGRSRTKEATPTFKESTPTEANRRPQEPHPPPAVVPGHIPSYPQSPPTSMPPGHHPGKPRPHHPQDTVVVQGTVASRRRDQQGSTSTPHHIPIFPTSRVFFVPSSSTDRMSLRARKKYRRGVRSACFEEETRERVKEREQVVIPADWHPIPVHRTLAPPTAPSSQPDQLIRYTTPPTYRSVAVRPPSSTVHPLATERPSSSRDPQLASPIKGDRVTRYSARETLLDDPAPSSSPSSPPVAFSSVLSGWQSRIGGAGSLPARPRPSTTIGSRPALRADTFEHHSASSQVTDC